VSLSRWPVHRLAAQIQLKELRNPKNRPNYAARARLPKTRRPRAPALSRPCSIDRHRRSCQPRHHARKEIATNPPRPRETAPRLDPARLLCSRSTTA
jgi:hypothetical protein